MYILAAVADVNGGYICLLVSAAYFCMGVATPPEHRAVARGYFVVAALYVVLAAHYFFHGN